MHVLPPDMFDAVPGPGRRRRPAASASPRLCMRWPPAPLPGLQRRRISATASGRDYGLLFAPAGADPRRPRPRPDAHATRGTAREPLAGSPASDGTKFHEPTRHRHHRGRAPETRGISSIDRWCAGSPAGQAFGACARTRRLPPAADNLFRRVRALFFLAAIHRYHLPARPISGAPAGCLMPASAGCSSGASRRP